MEGPRLLGVTLYSPHSMKGPRGGGGLLALGFPVGHGAGLYLRVSQGQQDHHTPASQAGPRTASFLHRLSGVG